MRNSLHIPTMTQNLIPPLIMREVGLVVNVILCIYVSAEDLNNETHCIVATEDANRADLKIPLTLDGILFGFQTRKLTEDEVETCKYIPTVSLSP